MKQNLEKN